MDVDRLVEEVARAIDEVEVFSRYNDWTSDRVPGLPVEICRPGGEGEDGPVVIARFPHHVSEDDALWEVESQLRARSAILATLRGVREADSATINAGWRVGINDGDITAQRHTAMIDHLIKAVEG